MGWPSRAGPRPARLRSASARRRRRGSTRRAARASPLRSPGPAGPVRIAGPRAGSSSLRSVTVRRRRRGSPRRAARTSPLRSWAQRGPVRNLRCLGRAGPVGARAGRPPTSPHPGPRGGSGRDFWRSFTMVASPCCGERGGTCPSLRGPTRRPGVDGGRGGRVPSSLALIALAAGAFARSYHPSWDKQVASNEALPTNLVYRRRGAA
jgi:hypothetical protein